MGYQVGSREEMQSRIDTMKSLGYVYVYGAKYTGRPITKAEIDQFRRDNSQMYTDEYYRDTINKCVGHYAIDCSGLVCHVWGITDTGSWYIADFGSTKPDLFTCYEYTSDFPIQFGDCLWKSGHVAFVMDNSTLYEAAGLYAGVRTSPRNINAWKRVIRPKMIRKYDYDNIGWNREPDGKWWYSTGHYKGEYYANEVQYINGQQYVFDTTGYLVTDPTMEFNSNGSIKSISGKIYRS